MTDFALLGIKVDSREVREATKRLDEFRGGSRRASRGAAQFRTASQRLERQLANTLSPLRQMRNLLIGVGVVEAVKGITRMADEYQLLNARILTVTANIEEQQMAINALRESANQVGVSLESATKLFIRTQRVREEIGATTSQVLQFVDTIQKITLVSGASAQESSAAMVQLSQAMASGTLRGDELRSVMEQIPAVVKTIADEYDITIGQFRKLAEEGNITAEAVFKAINNATKRVEEEASRMPDTVGRAFGALRNEIQAFTGDINKQFNLTGKLAESIRWMAENIYTLIDALKLFISLLAGKLVSSILAATLAQAKHTIALKADTAERLRNAAAAKIQAQAALSALQAQQAYGPLVSGEMKKLNKAYITLTNNTNRYHKAINAAWSLSFLGRLSRFVSIFGGIPGIITTAAIAFFTFKSETDRVADSLEELEQQIDTVNTRIIDLAVGQNIIRAREKIARLKILYSELTEEGEKFADMLQRQNYAFGIEDKQRAEQLNKRAVQIRKAIEREEEYIEKVKEGYKELQKPPENLKGALDPLIGQDDKIKKAADKLEDYIDRLEEEADQQKALASAYQESEEAVAALNEQLAVRNALLAANQPLTFADIDRIREAVRTTEKYKQVIQETKDAQEASKRAAEEAARKQRESAERAAEEFQEPFKRAAENIQRNFADTFTEIYRNGKFTFEDFADSIKAIMARLAGEITALMIFRPQIAAGGIGGIFGSLGMGGAQAAGGPGAMLAQGAPYAALMASNPYALAATTAAAAGFSMYSSGAFGSQRGIAGGLLGGAGGAYLALAMGSPWMIPIGAALGAFAGGSLGSLFGGDSEKQKFGYRTGVAGDTGPISPFGVLGITKQQDVNGTAILESLASMDRNIAKLLDPEQIARVTQTLQGREDFYSANTFDNESFDVVRRRLGLIIDAVAENRIASQLLDRIERDPGNIDQLVGEAERIINLIQMFKDIDAEPLNDAEQAIKDINDRFDEFAEAAKELGFAIDAVEAKRQKSIQQLTTDFDQSIKMQILAIERPLEYALEEERLLAQSRIENARTLGADITEVERLNALRRQQIIEQFANQTTNTLEGAFDRANDSIREFLDTLDITERGGLTISDRVDAADKYFNRLLGSARTDAESRQDLASFLPQFVDLKREQLGSTAAFFEFKSFLDSTLRNLVDQEDTTTTLKDIGSAITTGDNAIVDTLVAENASLKKEIKLLRSDINLFLRKAA